MAKHRETVTIHKEPRYYIPLHKAPIYDPKLSFCAKGLLHYLSFVAEYSHTVYKNFEFEDIFKGGSDPYERVCDAIEELTNSGYIEIKQGDIQMLSPPCELPETLLQAGRSELYFY